MPVQSLPSFPVPVFAALVLAWLLLRARLRGDAAGVVQMLLAICALQAGLIALAMHYGQLWAGIVLPVTAAPIPPLAWVALVTTAQRPARRADLWHLAGPVLVALCRLLLPEALDLAIPALFLGYGLAMLWALRRGADGVPRLALGAGDRPSRLWQAIAAALILSGISDVIIALAQATGQGGLVPWVISVASSLTLGMVGALALAPDLRPDAPEDEGPAPRAPDPAAEAELMARLAALMARDRPYLDPDLSLNRLARRLHVPAKRLSEAINRQTGGNVARYINAHRISAATEALRTGQSVTEAMLDSGFSTKSNFNREFLRVTGQTPSGWIAAGAPLRGGGQGATFSG